MNKNPKIAVMTGDLVHSTELGQQKIVRAFAAMEASAKTQESWHGAPLSFTRHRGDGWQVVLARPEMALRSALAFRAALRAEGAEFDSYIGIAEGPRRLGLGSDLNKELGSAFVNSGNTLAIAQRTGPMRMAHASKGCVEATTHLVDHISSDWTQSQAMTALAFLAPGAPPSYTEVAKSHGKSRQAVTKAVDAASLPALRYALEMLEENPDA